MVIICAVHRRFFSAFRRAHRWFYFSNKFYEMENKHEAYGYHLEYDNSNTMLNNVEILRYFNNKRNNRERSFQWNFTPFWLLFRFSTKEKSLRGLCAKQFGSWWFPSKRSMRETRPRHDRAVHRCTCLSKTQIRSQTACGGSKGKTHEDRNRKAVGFCYAIVKRSETCVPSYYTRHYRIGDFLNFN